jgi:hypothetical protein
MRRSLVHAQNKIIHLGSCAFPDPLSDFNRCRDFLLIGPAFERPGHVGLQARLAIGGD